MTISASTHPVAAAICALPRIPAERGSAPEAERVALRDVLALFVRPSGSTSSGSKLEPQTPVWTGVTRDLSPAPVGVHDRFVRDRTGRIIACASEGPIDQARAVALRIMACVNACEGIPTEALLALRDLSAEAALAGD